MTERARVGPRGAALAAAVVVLGIALSVLAAEGLRAVERRGFDRLADRQAAEVRSAVAGAIRRSTDAARQVAASVGALGKPDRAGFAAVTAWLPTADVPGVRGVSMVVPAATARQAWPDVVPEAAPGVEDHYVVVLDRPLDGTSPRPGRDFGTVPATTTAFAASRFAADVRLSAPFPEAGDRSLAVVAPVAGGGWIVLVLRGQEFLAAALRDASAGSVGATLTVGDTALGVFPGGGSGDVRTARWTADGQTWELRTTPGGTDTASTGAEVWVVIVTGAGISALLGLLTWAVLAGRARDRARVAAALAERGRTERSARHQAALLQAVLSSIDEGVAVADEHGVVALLNPSARATLATPAPDDHQSHGVFEVDGLTPSPGVQLPIRHALSGASCADEFVVRTAARPDGVRVRVSATPLDLGTERSGALAVSRDVSELRAHEADLTAFATIATHELRTPLATVHGLLDQAARALPGDAVRTHLGRARTGVERMCRLVDDLIAYAAARDVALHLTDVDLDALVTEVLGGVLHPDRVRPDREHAPHVVLRRLPPVRGDAFQLRRLFSGLLGSAVDHTPPDETPRIAVRAHPVPGDDAWIRVEIADHGIGVPPGGHAQLFRTGDPGTGLYPESDLTLAICRRIVERHGGTITATDNPGGGTVVRFTLPAARVTGPPPDVVGTHLVGAVVGGPAAGAPGGPGADFTGAPGAGVAGGSGAGVAGGSGAGVAGSSGAG